MNERTLHKNILVDGNCRVLLYNDDIDVLLCSVICATENVLLFLQSFLLFFASKSSLHSAYTGGKFCKKVENQFCKNLISILSFMVCKNEIILWKLWLFNPQALPTLPQSLVDTYIFMYVMYISVYFYISYVIGLLSYIHFFQLFELSFVWFWKKYSSFFNFVDFLKVI